MATTDRLMIACPLCGGSGTCGSDNHTCPECKGSGRVRNVFAELCHGRYETPEETAAAEGRPVDAVREENARAKEWLANHQTEKWEHLGDAGVHEHHHLHCDDMQDIHCLECDCVLSDDEIEIAWPQP